MSSAFMSSSLWCFTIIIIHYGSCILVFDDILVFKIVSWMLPLPTSSSIPSPSPPVTLLKYSMATSSLHHCRPTSSHCSPCHDRPRSQSSATSFRRRYRPQKTSTHFMIIFIVNSHRPVAVTVIVRHCDRRRFSSTVISATACVVRVIIIICHLQSAGVEVSPWSLFSWNLRTSCSCERQRRRIRRTTFA